MQRKLALVIHSLEGGGAERVLANMANQWAAAGHHVTVLTLAAAAGDQYPLAEQVDRVPLNLMHDSSSTLSAIWHNWQRVRALRKALRACDPDRVISFTERMNVLVLLATRGMPVPVIVCERTDPRRHRIGRLWSTLRRWTYPRCWAAVVQTEAVQAFVKPLVRGKRVAVIPNAVFNTPPAAQRKTAEQAQRTCVSMGRLAEEKGLDLLLQAVARIADKHPGWQFKIYGEGQQRARLETLIRDSRLTQVLLCGWTPDPDQALAAADLFVLPSRFEGFPNALLEAMANGLAVISFDCDSGPREIVQHEVNGLLVPAEDTVALAAAMDRLMSNDDQRRRLGQCAREVVERFNQGKFFEQWESVLSGESR